MWSLYSIKRDCQRHLWNFFLSSAKSTIIIMRMFVYSFESIRVQGSLSEFIHMMLKEAEAEVCQYFAAHRWLRIWRLFLVEILKLGLVKILKFKFSRNAEIWLRFWSWCLVDIMEMKFDQNLCKNFDMTKEVILVSRTQPSSPLCFWQCLFLSEMWLPRRCFSHARDTCLVD